MFGGLQIEMATLKLLGDWLEDSGWTNTLVQADIAHSGTANFFIHASHVTQTRLRTRSLLQAFTHSSNELIVKTKHLMVPMPSNWIVHVLRSGVYGEQRSVFTLTTGLRP